MAILLYAAASVAPVSALNPEASISQYLHTAWKSDAGLQSVRRLKQTPDGYLWLGTRAGLARFDGVQFSTYRAGSVEGLESSIVQDLLVDPDGSLWIGTLGGGLAHYEQGKFHSYTTRDGLPSDDINSLYRDRQGVLWIGSRDGKIARLVRGQIEQVSLAIPAGPITAFGEGNDQSLWIATFGYGVYRLQSGRLTGFSVEDGLPDVRVSGLYRDRSGTVWTSGWKGVSSWNGSRFVGDRIVNAVVNYAITCTEDRDGNFWIASSSGLFRVQSGKVTKTDRDSGLSSDFASDVLEDREGNLWIGTRSGLDRLRDGPVRTFSDREGLIHSSGPIVTVPDGSIWTVSAEHISRIAARNVVARRLGSLAGRTTFTLLSQPDSRLLIGCEEGGLLWDGQRAQPVRELAGLDVRSLLRARDGSLWIGTANRGLLHWKRTGTGTGLETIIPDKVIVTLAEDHAGIIWGGSNFGGGLYRIEGRQVQTFGGAQGLRSPYIYTLFVDGQGALWVGSMGGLSWFEGAKLHTANSQAGLPSDQVFALVDDSYGRLWFAGWGGIACISKSQLTEWAAGRRKRLMPTIYRSADGLQPYSVGATFPNTARSRDGHLWFSTADGVSEVIPPDPGAPHGGDFQVLVEHVRVDGVLEDQQDRLRIPPGARSIEIGYTAPTLSSPESVRFRYRLEGIDRNWVEVDSRRTAFYNELNPGTYTFRVAASSDQEHWREAPALILTQLPFFYQTLWFLLLVSMAIMSLAFVVYRLRVQHALGRIQAGFQERMDERARIAQELHDTVVQAIAGSTMLVENAADKVPDSLPVVKGTLLRAKDGLDFALSESRAALKGLRNSTRTENDLAKQLSEVAYDANNRHISFKLVITGQSRGIRPMIHYEVLRIGAEAIGNAFRHSHATAIRVELVYLNGLRLSVRDNGKGMSAEVRQWGRDGHYGLQVMRERADRIGARLAVYSRLDEGTEVELTTPGSVAFESDRSNPSLLTRALSRLKVLTRRTSTDDSGA